MNIEWGFLSYVLSAAEPEKGGLRDIWGPAEIGLPVREASIIAGVLICLSLFIWWMVRLYKKRQQKTAEPQRVLTPEEVALNRLNDPALAEALQNGDLKLFYFAISDATREYIAARYSIDAMDYTTHELLFSLGVEKKSSAFFSLVEVFFNHCDLVKFAKLRPSEEEAKSSLLQAFKIITLSEDSFAGQEREEQQEEVVKA